MKYEAIIFDMDGVLLDSTSCHAAAFQQVLKSYGIENFEYEAIAGMHTKTAFLQVFKQNKIAVSEEELKSCVSKKRDLAFEALVKSQPFDENISKVLKGLSQKYKLALASSASKRLVDWFVKSTDSAPYFAICLSGDQVKDAKPSPEIYLRAAKELSLSPSSCAVIEDAESGIRSAISATMDVYVKLGTLKEAPKGEKRIIASFKNLDSLLNLL